MSYGNISAYIDPDKCIGCRKCEEFLHVMPFIMKQITKSAIRFFRMLGLQSVHTSLPKGD